MNESAPRPALLELELSGQKPSKHIKEIIASAIKETNKGARKRLAESESERLSLSGQG